jgi:DNA-binding FrmR family transcriptional regulator
MGHGYITDKDDYLKRLRRAEEQAEGDGFQRLRGRGDLGEDVDAVDVLLDHPLQTPDLLDDHLAHCVVDAAKAGGPDADAKLQEASAAIARLVRS